jgi:hypothetical protein
VTAVSDVAARRDIVSAASSFFTVLTPKGGQFSPEGLVSGRPACR